MKLTIQKSKALSVVICFVLIAAMALTMISCQSQKQTDDQVPTDNVEEAVTVSFTLVIMDENGEKDTKVIETTEKTVGAALLKEGIIDGDETEYGLYVKTVNGITADYDTDGTYWAFYINDEYAMTGVDSTEIDPDSTYMFRIDQKAR